MTKMTDLRSLVRRKSILTLVFVALLSVLLFAVASGSHLRSDWSENQTSSLSSSTLSVLNGLKEPIQIKAYFTAGLPQPYGQLQQFIEDSLMNYRDAGHGNIGFEMVHPEDDPNTGASLQALGIPKVQVQVVEDDRAQVRQAYLAIVIEYLDKQETIPVVQTDAGFEYLLTRKIKKLTGEGKQTIAVATGFGAADLNHLQTLQQLLQDDYDFVSVDLGSDEVPTSAQALIVDGVDKQPSSAFIKHLNAFRNTGHGVLVLASNVEPQLQAGFSVKPVDPYANDWLRDELGVDVAQGLVMDQQASRITVNQQQGGFAFRTAVDFPFIANVVDINKEHIITKGLESVSMPFAAPIMWSDKVEKQEVLLRSSSWSSVQGGPPFDVNPLVDMRTRFQGMHLAASNLMLVQEDEVSTHVKKGRLIVSGSSALLDNEFIEGTNSVLILNMLDWLSHDEALIDLRSKGVTQRPLEPLSKEGRTFFKVIWIFALPCLLLVFAAWRWLVLRKRQLRV